MIIDSLQNAEKYFGLHPLFSRAFKFIQENDLMALPHGTIQIEEGLKVIVSQKTGKSAEESLKKFECHDANIDIQVCVKGTETIGWKPRETCVSPKTEYDAAKDVQFFEDHPDMFFQLKDGQFVIFYPNDVHAPMIGDDEIRKLVFKVKFNSDQMSNIQKVSDAVVKQGILPLYFNADETVTIETLRAIYRAGIRAVEYTNRGEAALNNFKKMVETRNSEMQDLLLGIGTIKNLEQAKDFVEAGADFFISPGFVPEVADFLIKQDKFYSPGCMTPTEIIAVENAGVKFIKLFPGNMLGPDFLSGIKDIFPNLLFMPTGGVDTTRENIEGWFKAGVSAVGMGSKLISKRLMSEQNYSEMESETKKVLETVQSVKNA